MSLALLGGRGTESMMFLLHPPHPQTGPREKEDLHKRLSSSRGRAPFSAQVCALSHKLSCPTCRSQFSTSGNYGPVFMEGLADFMLSFSSHCCLECVR